MYDLQAVIGSTPAFLQTYITKVPEGEILALLEAQLTSVPAFFRWLPEDRLTHSYAPGKWTPKDLLLHLIDSERVFAYRVFRFGRGDTTALAGFDENHYVPMAGANDRSLDNLLAEFEAVRNANLVLFRGFSEEELWREGTASGYQASGVALMYAIVGHAVHHLAVIEAHYLS